LSLEEKVVFCSLIVLFPFIFQREALWDSGIFAFLFAPSIIRFLQKGGNVSMIALIEPPMIAVMEPLERVQKAISDGLIN
jgi:hypothetical protein